jgi:hypothetical protein
MSLYADMTLYADMNLYADMTVYADMTLLADMTLYDISPNYSYFSNSLPLQYPLCYCLTPNFLSSRPSYYTLMLPSVFLNNFFVYFTVAPCVLLRLFLLTFQLMHLLYTI